MVMLSQSTKLFFTDRYICHTESKPIMGQNFIAYFVVTGYAMTSAWWEKQESSKVTKQNNGNTFISLIYCVHDVNCVLFSIFKHKNKNAKKYSNTCIKISLFWPGVHGVDLKLGLRDCNKNSSFKFSSLHYEMK